MLTTGEIGSLRREARQALDAIGDGTQVSTGRGNPDDEPLTEAPDTGAEVFVVAFGAPGRVTAIAGRQVEVDVRGKRIRVPLSELRRPRREGLGQPRPAAGRSRPAGSAPDGGRPLELMVIGATVDEALARAEKFLDDALLSDGRRLRVVHGHGTGKLREALTRFFRSHPLVATVERAPDNEGGGGATIVHLKDE